MTKILFLLPPSEWKNKWWNETLEKLSFTFEKPKSIAINATEKDLKSKWFRYEEWITLNKAIVSWKSDNYAPARSRYSWVMYNAIWYDSLSETWKLFFDENFLILSWMYWLVRSQDIIGNYKLPIETKWLLSFWGDSITKEIQFLKPDCIVNLLPLSYQKMIDFAVLGPEIMTVNFCTEKNWELKKITHGVKKVKWEWIRRICELQIKEYKHFWWEVTCNTEGVEVTIII
jgi:cytoplasmic iron level regulating protein YaaA (DUF328/UPF0246 family)